jgi:hypothetical protein
VGAYAEVALDTAGGDAESRFRDLEHKQVIEVRLLALKQRIAGALPAGPADPAADKS